MRNWWLSALAVLAVTILYAASQISSLSADRGIISRAGHPTKVRIDSIEGVTRIGYGHDGAGPPNVVVSFVAKDPQGQDVRRELKGRLDSQRLGARVGQEIEIYIDPNNPERWTDRKSAGLADSLLMAWILLPLGLLLAAVAALRRQAVLAVWRNSPPAEAVVMRVQQSAVYPGSYVLRMAIKDSKDRRMVGTVVPRSAGRIEEDDLLPVVAPPDRPQSLLVAQLYM